MGTGLGWLEIVVTALKSEEWWAFEDVWKPRTTHDNNIQQSFGLIRFATSGLGP